MESMDDACDAIMKAEQCLSTLPTTIFFCAQIVCIHASQDICKYHIAFRRMVFNAVTFGYEIMLAHQKILQTEV